METGEVVLISDGNGGTLYAKIDEFDRYYVWYKVRKSSRGPWSRGRFDCSRAKWKKLVAAAASD